MQHPLLIQHNIRGDLPNDGINSRNSGKTRYVNNKIINNHDFRHRMYARSIGQPTGRYRASYRLCLCVGIRGTVQPIFCKAERFELLHNGCSFLQYRNNETLLKRMGRKIRPLLHLGYPNSRSQKRKNILCFQHYLDDHKGRIAQQEGAALVSPAGKKICG